MISRLTIRRRTSTMTTTGNFVTSGTTLLTTIVTVDPVYVYADIGRFADDSFVFVRDLLRATGVCLVPGKDFGLAAPQRHVRISYATSLDRLEAAVERMRRYLR